MYNDNMLSAHKEKEYKMMIDSKLYETLLKDLHLSPTLQTNYYYDTGLNNMAMRIRVINGINVFTLKVKQDGYKDEYEFIVDNNDLTDQKIIEVMNHFKIKNPKYLGRLDTQRSTLKMTYGELCIDHSIYFDKEDYEIEYELYDADKDINIEFLMLLKKYNLEFKESYKTKFGRFKEACLCQ